MRAVDAQWQPWVHSRPIGARLGGTVVPAPRVPVWEQVFAVSALILATGGGNFVLRRSEADPVKGDPLIQALWVGIYAVSILLMLVQPGQRPLDAFRAKLPWIIVALTAVSLFWSAAPQVTLKRSAALVGTTVFAAYLATRYDRQELFRLLLWSTAISAALSLLVVVAMPSQGVEHTSTGQAWKGIFGQKNWLGRMMAFSSVLWLLYAIGHRRRRLLSASVIALSAILLLLSLSKTALVVFGTLALLVPILRLRRLHDSLAVPALTLVVVAGGVVVSYVVRNLDAVLTLLERDETLSGRDQLWAAVWDMIAQRPFLGYGYGGFWLGYEGPSFAIWRAIQWAPPHAHNGFLDLWLDLGAVGLSLFLLSLAANAARALALIRRDRTVEAMFPALFLAFLVLSNVTETNLVTHNSIFWILYVVVSIHLCAPRYRPPFPRFAMVPLRSPFGLNPQQEFRQARAVGPSPPPRGSGRPAPPAFG